MASSVTTTLGIPYLPSSSSSFQSLDIHALSDANNRPLVVFVHGGAWRDEDKSQHIEFAHRLAQHTRCSVAVPNYRLTPKQHTETDFLNHPTHCEDVLASLEFLHKNERGSPYDRSRIYTLGHSAGAHILGCIFLDSTPVTPSLRPSDGLLKAVQSVVGAAGIYDLPLLLMSFPPYADYFVTAAFGASTNLSTASTTYYNPYAGGAHIQWHIIGSHNDELLDPLQSEVFTKHLQDKGALVDIDLESLAKGHYDMVTQGDELPSLMAKYVQ